jgi:hypothetical protein
MHRAQRGAAGAVALLAAVGLSYGGCSGSEGGVPLGGAAMTRCQGRRSGRSGGNAPAGPTTFSEYVMGFSMLACAGYKGRMPSRNTWKLLEPFRSRSMLAETSLATWILGSPPRKWPTRSAG